MAKKVIFNPTTGKLDFVSEEDLSGYVPYTGATTDVDLGVHTLTSSWVYLGSDVELGYSIGDNSFQLTNATSYLFNFATQDADIYFDMQNINATQTFAYPNKSGNIALTSDAVAYAIALG